jgi:hypothetical protein
MFSQSHTNEATEDKNEKSTEKKETVPYINKYSNQVISNSINFNTLDSLLEKEKQHNKTEPWNKIDKTVKTQLLHSFAETYGHEHQLPIKEIKNLKVFFSESLNRGKLQKNKDISYDKDNRKVLSIPSLFFNSEKRHFTLRIVDTKRVSTLKSLTPKKNTSIKNNL